MGYETNNEKHWRTAAIFIHAGVHFYGVMRSLIWRIFIRADRRICVYFSFLSAHAPISRRHMRSSRPCTGLHAAGDVKKNRHPFGSAFCVAQ